MTLFKLWCERRLGEMLAKEIHCGGDSKTRQSRGDTTLADLDISRDMSSRSQKIAQVPEDKFEAVIGQLKQDEQDIKQMTPSQIAEAQKLAREWKPQKGPK